MSTKNSIEIKNVFICLYSDIFRLRGMIKEKEITYIKKLSNIIKLNLTIHEENILFSGWFNRDTNCNSPNYVNAYGRFFKCRKT